MSGSSRSTLPYPRAPGPCAACEGRHEAIDLRATMRLGHAHQECVRELRIPPTERVPRDHAVPLRQRVAARLGVRYADDELVEERRRESLCYARRLEAARSIVCRTIVYPREARETGPPQHGEMHRHGARRQPLVGAGVPGGAVG